MARIGRLSGRRHAFGAAAPSAFALAAQSGEVADHVDMRGLSAKEVAGSGRSV
jgi:hypothetical protein